MRRTLFVSIISITILTACGGGEEGPKTPETKEEYTAAITEVEAILKDPESMELSPENAKRAIDLYRSYADQYPQDERTPEYLWQAAQVNIGLGQYKDAISYFDRIINNYPAFAKVPNAVYMIGFVYEIHLKQLGQAQEHYQKVIDGYPDSELANDAQGAIRNLTMSEEELIQFLKGGQAVDSTAVDSTES